MGFLKSAGKLAMEFGQETIKDMQKKEERVQRYVENLERKSDEEVKKTFKSTSNMEMKRACIIVLENRGYSRG